MQAKKKTNKSIVIFTSPSCIWCTRAKNYFNKRGLKYKTIDITKDKNAANDCLRHGCRGVPVILIGGTFWICGFDEKKIENALGK
ncbi:MAG TPA: glutaredoxin family protein [Epsilonproteobacteria bacterium]|nr:glutaredoxin family protein [Campylobacterota bacterium]